MLTKLTVKKVKNSKQDVTVVSNCVMENPNLTAYSKLVYYVLAKMANKQRECFPSELTISSTCCISVSSVKRALKQLEYEKILKIIRVGKNNKYKLNDK